MSEALDSLIAMSKELGDPSHDLVILGEGNTSARADDSSFWVKASGTQLVSADPSMFVRVSFAPIAEALEQSDLGDEEIHNVLRQATLEGERTPSIETFLHALCLQLDGISFVGHTHPAAAVGLLCSANSRELFNGALFPDQIVSLGATPAIIPYADPGLPLARTVRYELDEYLYRHGTPPRTILMENHGIITLGKTAKQVVNVTRMVVKTSRIISTALLAGGLRYLTPQQIDRIDNRPDERKRRDDLN